MRFYAVKLAFLLFIVVLGVSCKKKENNSYSAVVQGYVITFDDTDTVENALVELYETNRLHISGNIDEYERLIGTATADSNGLYRISFNATTGYYYALRAIKEKYYASTWAPPFSLRGEVTEIPVQIAPLSWLRFEIDDVEALEYDSLVFDYTFTVKTGTDTIVVVPHHHMTDILYVWDLYKNGIKTREFIYGSTCAPFDTCNVEIMY